MHHAQQLHSTSHEASAKTPGMMRWIIGLSLAALVVLVGGALLLIAGWGDGLGGGCGNTVVKTARSPDGQLDVVLFERSCGATTGFSTQISIVPAGDLPDGGGNVFVTDDDSGADDRGEWGGVWADVFWLSDRRLHIDHAPSAGVLKSSPRFGDVTITYGVGWAPRQSPSPSTDARSPAS